MHCGYVDGVCCLRLCLPDSDCKHNNTASLSVPRTVRSWHSVVILVKSLETDMPESKGWMGMVTVQQPPGFGPLWSRVSAYTAPASAGQKFLGSERSYLKSPLKQLDLDGNRAAATVGTREKPEKDRDTCGGSIPGSAGKPAFWSQSRCEYTMVTQRGSRDTHGGHLSTLS